jgi:hypothetical protein
MHKINAFNSLGNTIVFVVDEAFDAAYFDDKRLQCFI